MSYRRPRFVREESWRYKRVKAAWRAPHGKTSRVRRSKKGWPAVVKIGYSHSRASRGLHPSGLREIIVWRPKDLIGLDPKLQVVRIGHTVGENKRVQIIDEAKKANIRILNPGLKKPTETLPAAPAEPTVEAPAEPTAASKTEEGTEVKAEEPSRPKPKKKAKPKTKTRRKSKK